MNKLTLAVSIPSFTSETANIGGVRLHYCVDGDPNGQPVPLVR